MPEEAKNGGLSLFSEFRESSFNELLTLLESTTFDGSGDGIHVVP